MVDLGEDLDVEGAVVLEATIGLAEIGGQVPQVLGTENDLRPRLRDDVGQIAPAVPGQDDAVDPRGHLEMPRDPAGRHQRGDGDRQHGDLGFDTVSRREVSEDLAERELGQAAGDEQEPPRTARSPDRPPVDADDLPGEELRVGPHEEPRGAGDVLGRAPAFQRRFAP